MASSEEEKYIYRRYKGYEERDERTAQMKQCLGRKVKKYGRKKARIPMEEKKFSRRCEKSIFFFRRDFPIVLLNIRLNCNIQGVTGGTDQTYGGCSLC